jgi:uncharacterized protein with von Willebrand factor type A (vWA) domain
MSAEHLLDNVVLFARTLRAARLAVPANAAIDAVRALEIVGVERRDDVCNALRAVLVSRQEDVDRFERLFNQFWQLRVVSSPSVTALVAASRRAATSVSQSPGAIHGDVDDLADRQDDRVAPIRTYSHSDVWRTKDFATYDAADLARARTAIAEMTWTPGLRTTRRWVAGRGHVADPRRLLRVNLRHGGEPLVIPHRVRRLARRRLVVLCDVSASMTPYTRLLLLFLHALAARYPAIELFLFSTRLTRVTRPFVDRPLGDALTHVRDTARDWSGGTRIGEALRTFNVEWSRRVLRGGAVALLISDGWDLGEPDLLQAEIARLQRACHRLIWLNPLAGSPGYEPLTRGMRAALPSVDDFLSVRNMASLEVLAERLAVLPAPRRRGSRRGSVLIARRIG